MVHSAAAPYTIICETVPGAKEKAIELLLVAKDKVPTPPDLGPEGDSAEEEDGEYEDEDEDEGEDEHTDGRENAPAQQPSGKRPRYSQCERCGMEFDIGKNSRTSCVYHPEKAQAEDRLFEDNDFFGPDEAEYDPHIREEYPDCFTFECCGDTLEDNPDGCKTGWHREAAPGMQPAKRNRAF
ncbi:hypothetical protein N7451_011619 [Penicillium sp. IBT 35674x]|nr:hypothetical protein N7451_011619 [Penicillium sp. IBT 35674x]